jgi:hypothetical protein
LLLLIVIFDEALILLAHGSLRQYVLGLLYCMRRIALL